MKADPTQFVPGGAAIVLHGLWYARQFHLWAETGAPTVPASLPIVADSAGTSLPPHPSAMPSTELHAVVGELTADGLLASSAGEGTIGLWLPSDEAGPRSSTMPSTDDSPLAQATPTVAYRAYSVPTLAFEPADAVDLLRLLSDLATAGPRLGDGPGRTVWTSAESLTFWSRLADYVLALLARGRFLPDLVETPADDRSFAPAAPAAPGPYVARWRPVITDPTEHEWIAAMAAALPPACRSCASSPCPNDPLEIVESFIEVCADSVIRGHLGDDPFFREIHERAVRPEAPWETRWLSALIDQEAVVRGDADQNASYAHHIRAWVGRVECARTPTPPKLWFELVEPLDAPDDDVAVTLADGVSPAADSSLPPPTPWRLQFHWEAQDGSGRRYDADPAWTRAGRSPGLLRREAGSLREQFEADLLRAADAFPLLERALCTGVPSPIDLTTAEAHSFLRDGTALLEARGFGVLLPAWAHQPEQQLGLRLSVAPSDTSAGGGPVTAGAIGLNALVDFQWHVAIGDAELTVEEFERLRAQGLPLVRLRGEWIHLDTDAADRAAEFIRREGRGRMTLRQAIRAAAGADDLSTGLPIYGIDGAAWIERFLGQAPTARLEIVEQPPGFSGVLRGYQLRGVSWMSFMERLGCGACLADDMGLGKTIQLIALLLLERMGGQRPGPTLIFCPMSVVGNWEREIQRFAPSLRVLVHHGPGRLVGDDFLAALPDIDAVVTTYALGHRDSATLGRVHWHRIALDEAQKIKNPSAAQTIAVRSLPATNRLALTGTPLENHLSELWSIMEALNPGLLGTAADFRRRFAVPVERFADRQRSLQLRTLVRPFMLRRIKNDPAVECDLPEKMEMRVYCNLTAEQAALYERVVADALTEVESADGIRRRGVILAALTRLKQVCNHPVHYRGDGGWLDQRSGKCERLVEMLEEALAEGDAALIFTQFRRMGELLQQMLTARLNTEVLFLHGGTPNHKRQEMIARFQDPSNGVRLFLLSLRAGGLGLNLTAANHVFHFDRWWNPAVEDQATDRAHRIGQTRRVQVHKFVCIGTIEDRIDRLLADKVALADHIVGSGDEWLTELSTEELRNYLTLSPEAVGEI